MNLTAGYLMEDLNRCGFSLRSLSNLDNRSGIKIFSISSILSTDKSLIGSFRSSKADLKLCDFFSDIFNIVQQKKRCPNIVNNFNFFFMKAHLVFSYRFHGRILSKRLTRLILLLSWFCTKVNLPTISRSNNMMSKILSNNNQFFCIIIANSFDILNRKGRTLRMIMDDNCIFHLFKMNFLYRYPICFSNKPPNLSIPLKNVKMFKYFISNPLNCFLRCSYPISGKLIMYCKSTHNLGIMKKPAENLRLDIQTGTTTLNSTHKYILLIPFIWIIISKIEISV